ncbi:hypothetical protein NP493_349g02002 [Ridgeia piscesae]|uniref:Disease resistance R13L4/SHOC-2-like LRR domain-containing protein n=1 Tax=Ridgeia piscesae TaxID=27915 RepID=A0AAD9NVJ3_RIDPI|nr:hypothetical protein NP493_349g02002 [Ridgeia piscesae]
MGNTEAHDFDPAKNGRNRELDLSRKVTYKQFQRHIKREYSEACMLELPWSVRDAVSLYERMDVSFNCLTEVPVELPLRLPHLEYINMSHNQLTSLPESFGLLIHLHTIIVNNNRLTSLPNSFMRLMKLKKLDVSHNALRSLPDDLGKMESLSKLNIQSNKLKTLPASLGVSPVLTVILAKDNPIKWPPSEVCKNGSDAVLDFLRDYSANHKVTDKPLPFRTNVFPRVRGNQSLYSAMEPPRSPLVQYMQAQTDTSNTPSRVKTPLLPPIDASADDAHVLRDKIVAIGDAIGIATENMDVDECRFYYDPVTLSYSDIIRDSHRVSWRPGDWTVDFDQLALVLESLICWAGVADELDFAKSLQEWSSNGFKDLGDRDGFYVCDVISQVVKDDNFLQDPHLVARQLLEASENAETNNDNGAVARCMILGVPQFHKLNEVAENAARICKATHADPRCVASSVMVAVVIALMLQGRHDLTDGSQLEAMISAARDVAISYLTDKAHQKELQRHTTCSDFNIVKEDDRTHEAMKPLAAGLAALRMNTDFRSSITQLVMQGADSNVNACVAGALLGCRVGYSLLPPVWVSGLREKQVAWLNSKTNLFLDMMGLP